MSATDHGVAHKATTDLSLRLAYLREIVSGKLYPSELKDWLAQARTEETCENGSARRLMEPWLDALAAARGRLFQDGALTGPSAAAMLLQLYDRARLLTTVALSDAFAPQFCTLRLGQLAGRLFRPEDQGFMFRPEGQDRCLDLLSLSAGTGAHTCRLYLGFLTGGRHSDLLEADVLRCRSIYAWWLELMHNSPDALRIIGKDGAEDRLGLLQTLMLDYRFDFVQTEVDFEYAALNQPQPDGPTGQSSESRHATHNADFTMVRWFGTEYTFALGIQSGAVKVLWEEWERLGLGLHQQTIRMSIDTARDRFRMDTVFRGHPAFWSMIQPCGDGLYKLAEPADQKPRPKRPKKTPNKSPKGRQKRR